MPEPILSSPLSDEVLVDGKWCVKKRPVNEYAAIIKEQPICKKCGSDVHYMDGLVCSKCGAVNV